jgi:AcrR family transcriptional regulator
MSRSKTRAAADLPRTRTLVHGEIIRAAASCFGEMGYRATTLQTIAARAGVSKVTLYKYVSSKEDLLCRVFEHTIETSRTGLRQIAEQELLVEDKLRRIIRYQVTLLATHLPFLTVFFSEESGLPAPIARRVAREKREYDRTIERVFREGVGAGRFRDLPPTLFVFALDGMCNWMHKWFRPQGPQTPDQIADFFVDLLERGYARGAAADPVAIALRRVERRLARLERRVGVRRREAGDVPRR